MFLCERNRGGEGLRSRFLFKGEWIYSVVEQRNKNKKVVERGILVVLFLWSCFIVDGAFVYQDVFFVVFLLATMAS